MATQTLEFNAGTGLTISCKLFAFESDTVVATVTATEKTNDLNRYSVAFTDIPAGAYRLNGFVGAVGGFVNEQYDLLLATDTYLPRSEVGIASTAIPTANIERGTTQHAEIVFAFPTGSLADGDFTTQTVRIDGASAVNITGAITYLYSYGGQFWYSITYNAADLPAADAEGMAQYVLSDGTDTLVINLRVAAGGGGEVTSPVGPGAISHPVNITSEGNPVDGAEVWISTDEDGLNVIAGTLHTDAMGDTPNFMLDAGTYYVWVQKSGVNFTNPTEIEVAAP